jgi:hypothetical protein
MHAQMGRRLAITAALALELCARQVAGHGAMTFPRPRNALDGDLAPWTNWSYPCDSTHQEKMCRRIHSSSICFKAGSTWGMSLASARRDISAADKPRTGRRPRAVVGDGSSGLMMPKDRQPTPPKRPAGSWRASRPPAPRSSSTPLTSFCLKMWDWGGAITENSDGRELHRTA